MAQPPGTTILYLVRHGQTEANAQNLICGDAESPLNEKGRKQAVDLAEQMAEIDFDIAYTSPLSRASDTCDAILAGRDVEKIVTRDLREQDRHIRMCPLEPSP